MSYQRNILTSAIATRNIKLFNNLIEMKFDMSYQGNLSCAMDIAHINKYFFRILVKNDYYRKNRVNGLNFIHHAILTKNYYCLKRLIRNEYSVVGTADLDSALLFCIVRENYQALNIMLYELNKLYKNNNRLFLKIVNEEICEVEDNIIIDKYSLLGFASNLEDIFLLLLEYGANPFYVDFYCQTILYTVCIECNINIMQKLLTIPNMKKHINIENAYGYTPLIEVVKAEDIELANLLLENGADPKYIPINDIYSWTALHEASYLNDPDMIRALLTYGANINAPDIIKQTPLYYAIRNRYSLHPIINTMVTRLLLENGADANNIYDFNNVNARKYAYNIQNMECWKEINWFYRKNFMIVYHYNINCDDDISRHFMMYDSPFRLLCNDVCRVICSYF